MFEEALLESAKHLPGARRTYSTAASLLLQAAALATFVVVPILTTHVMPELHERWITIPLPRIDSAAPKIEPSGTSTGPSISTTAPQLLQPRIIQRLDPNAKDPAPVQTSAHSESANPNSVLSSILSGTRPVESPADTAKPPVISVLEQGVVLSRVQPLYPHIAIANRVQGTVHLNAMITPNGTLEELHVLSGHPMLAQAAVEAVKQWRFRPYVLNGKPIEVQTEVIVNFSLN